MVKECHLDGPLHDWYMPYHCQLNSATFFVLKGHRVASPYRKNRSKRSLRHTRNFTQPVQSTPRYPKPVNCYPRQYLAETKSPHNPHIAKKLRIVELRLGRDYLNCGNLPEAIRRKDWAARYFWSTASRMTWENLSLNLTMAINVK